ncbi:MAG: hypothetical protein IJL14_00195 [Selenomonadaceae bacterium]|nr:hypothetical protein [Selenomonadaceae bacterium]
MRKFLIAAAASFLIFGGQNDIQAASLDLSVRQDVEVQEMKLQWAHFRDKYILGRETANERRDRHEWERRHRYDRDRYRDYPPPPPPPPPRYRGDGRRYDPPPPPPPPPPRYRDDRYRDYPPPPPPPPPPRRR